MSVEKIVGSSTHTHMNVCMWKSIKIQLSTGKKVAGRGDV